MEDMFYPERIGQVVEINEVPHQVVKSKAGCSDCDLRGKPCVMHSCLLWNADGSLKVEKDGDEKGIDVVYKKLSVHADTTTKE
jgi:hypothetical protein